MCVDMWIDALPLWTTLGLRDLNCELRLPLTSYDTANILWKYREPVDVSTTKLQCCCSGGTGLRYVHIRCD